MNVAAFPHENTPELVSLILSSLSVFFCVLFPFMSATLLYDKRKEIKNENPEYLKKFGTMYKDFKVHKEWYLFQYYPIFLLRRLIFVGFLVVMIEYPSTQCNCFILFSYLTFCFQAVAKPFEEEIVNFLCCINEGILG